MFGQMIQNILVYVIMINVLQGLVTSQGFREIFRFVGGMILIVLCVSPILSRISDTDQIGKYLTAPDRERYHSWICREGSRCCDRGSKV